MNPRVAYSCGLCGFPSGRGSTCSACGASTRSGTPLHDERKPHLPGEMHPEDFPELRKAFQAWRHQDYPKMIAICLAVMGLHNPTKTQLPSGPGWSFNQDSAAVYIICHTKREEVSVESPMLKLGHTKRVAMMRTLLEMNGRLGASRFCLRDDTVVLRFVEHGKHLPPPLLIAAVGEVALLADKFDDILAMTFDAKMIGPGARRSGYDIRMLGTSRTIPMVAKRATQASKRRQRALHPEGGGRGGLASLWRRALGTQASDPKGRLEPLAHEAPTSPKGALAAKTTSTDIEASWELCETVRYTLDIMEVLSDRNADPLTHLLGLRALMYQLHGRFQTSCPDTVWFLMGQSKTLMCHLPPDKNAFIAGTPEARRFMQSLELYKDVVRVVAQRGNVEGGPFSRYALPQFHSPAAAKQHLRQLLDRLDQSARSSMLHVSVLLGALYEMRARAQLPKALVAKVDGFIAEAEGKAVSDQVRNTLRGQVERIARPKMRL